MVYRFFFVRSSMLVGMASSTRHDNSGTPGTFVRQRTEGKPAFRERCSLNRSEADHGKLKRLVNPCGVLNRLKQATPPQRASSSCACLKEDNWTCGNLAKGLTGEIQLTENNSLSTAHNQSDQGQSSGLSFFLQQSMRIVVIFISDGPRYLVAFTAPLPGHFDAI
jgi:hypothetical protein